MNEFEELIRLTQENNAMLKEIVLYIRELKDPQNVQNDWQREMFFNILSDMSRTEYKDYIMAILITLRGDYGTI